MKITANDITYGFEIEGVFAKTLPDTLKAKGVHYVESGDGSVRQSNIKAKYGLRNEKILSNGQAELKAGVFDSQDEMENALALFNNGAVRGREV